MDLFNLKGRQRYGSSNKSGKYKCVIYFGSDVTTVLVVLWEILLINVVYKKENALLTF